MDWVNNNNKLPSSADANQPRVSTKVKIKLEMEPKVYPYLDDPQLTPLCSCHVSTPRVTAVAAEQNQH